MRMVTIAANPPDFPYRDEIISAIDVILCVRPMRTNFRKIQNHPMKTKVGPR